MKIAAAVIGTLVLIGTAQAVDPDRDFSGKWVLDSAGNRHVTPVAPDRNLSVSEEEVAVRCSAPAADGSSVKWSYLLDGTETRWHVSGDTRSSVAKWEGSALLINTLVSGPQNFTVMDRWKLSRDRSTLTITRQVVDRGGTSEDILVYHREGELSVRATPATAVSTPAPAAPKPFSSPEALEAALAGPAATPAEADLIVRSGTHLGLSLRNPVDTKHSHEGDHIYLQTIAPIAVDNRIVIPQGSFVNGTITQSKSAHGVKGKGELYIRFDSLTLPNGVTRDFRSRLASADSTAKGQVDKKEGKITGERDSTGDAQTVALGTGIGASVGGIAGAAAGHTLGGVGIGAAAGAAAGLAAVFHSKRPDAVLQQGTTLEMVLDRDLQFKSSELPF
jgi:type IV secretion system protein VirB10